MRYILIVLVLSLALTIPGVINPAFAQEAETTPTAEQTGQAPAAVRLEELEISLPSLEVLYIPRREVDLPPVKFTGTYLSGRLAPAPKLFVIDKKDLKPLRVEEVANLLAKERN